MINNEKLTALEINPTQPAQKCVIWLHGLGADGNDFAPIVPELNLPPSMNIRFILPHAPIMPVTINNGHEMRAWFDIKASDLTSRADVDGMQRSVQQINALIQHEIARGITPANIMLVGFSQGAVIALMTGLLSSERLAGIIALSGLFPHAESVIQQAPAANHGLPIFIAHGTEDSVLPLSLGRHAYDALAKASYPTDWHSYAMGHSVCLEEINDISDWIQKIWN